MKMNKDERDDYVKQYSGSLTIAQLAEHTGWGITTIKSVRIRLGLVTKNKKRAELENYCKNYYPSKSLDEIASECNTKIDNVRDTLKYLGLWKPSSNSESTFKGMFEKNFIILTKYRNAHSGITIQCRVCGKEYTKRANNFVSNRFKCCEGSPIIKTKRASDLTKRLNVEEGSALVVCGSCKTLRWLKIGTVNSKSFSGKCGSCSSRSSTKFQEKFLDYLNKEEITLKYQEDEIINRATKVEVEYKSKGIRACSARNIMRYKFKNDECFVYLMDFAEYGIKIGISSDPETRAKIISSSANIYYPNISILLKDGRSKCLEHEKNIHKLLKESSIKYGAVFSGSTEFFINSENVRNTIAGYLLSLEPV